MLRCVNNGSGIWFSKARKNIFSAMKTPKLFYRRSNEPYIQKYLVSLVVHLMTLPVTQIVSVACCGEFFTGNIRIWTRLKDVLQLEAF